MKTRLLTLFILTFFSLSTWAVTLDSISLNYNHFKTRAGKLEIFTAQVFNDVAQEISDSVTFVWTNKNANAVVNFQKGVLQYVCDTTIASKDTIVVMAFDPLAVEPRDTIKDTIMIETIENGKILSINLRTVNGGVTVKSFESRIGADKYFTRGWNNTAAATNSIMPETGGFKYNNDLLSPITIQSLNVVGANYNATNNYSLTFSEGELGDAERMFSGTLGKGAPTSFLIKNIPADFMSNSYDVVVYYSKFKNDQTTQTYTIGADSKTIVSSDTIFDGTYNVNEEYVVFESLVSDTFILTCVDNINNRASASGMQIFSKIAPVLIDTQSIAQFGYSGSLIVGDTITLDVLKSSKGLDVAYELSDSTAGVITGNQIEWAKAGDFTIYAKQAGNDTIVAAFDKMLEVTVAKGNETITFTNSGSYKVGDTITITIPVLASGRIFVLSIEPSDVVKQVVANAKYEFVKADTVTFKVKAAENLNYYADSAMFGLRIAKGLAPVITFDTTGLNAQFANVPAGNLGTETVNFTASASNDSTVHFASSNAAVVSVSANVATIEAAGTFVLEVFIPESDNYLGTDTAQYSFEVTVDFGVGVYTVGQNQVSVFPNPAATVVTISQLAENIQVISLTGSVVLEAANTKQVDVSGLASGLYVIKITLASGELIEQKLMID